MNELESTLPAGLPASNRLSVRLLDRIARPLVVRRFADLTVGRLEVSDQYGIHEFGSEKGADELAVRVNVRDARFYSYLAFGGAVGAAEAYINGYWTVDDLTKLIRLFVKNRDVLDGMGSAAKRTVGPLLKTLHRLNKNTRAGSRRNISAHYDLGNDFFRLWLDETMMYSSAVFERADMSLYEASVAKLDRICQKLELGPGDHVLEIGTGWGGFAVHAASKYGCNVTTTTISREQYEFAKARVEGAGLTDKVTLLMEDYRDLIGEYDKLVSIEMIEAVGSEYLDTYFEQCDRLLKPNGMMLIQAITIADQRYQQALRSVDFIQRYIFPGGFLPSVTAMLESLTDSTRMRLYHLEDIGEHYAKTLKAWRESFAENLHKVREMGFSDEFLRMWNYYYCYCEGAFEERAIGTVQMLLIKPDNRRSSLVPALTQRN